MSSKNIELQPMGAYAKNINELKPNQRLLPLRIPAGSTKPIDFTSLEGYEGFVYIEGVNKNNSGEVVYFKTNDFKNPVHFQINNNSDRNAELENTLLKHTYDDDTSRMYISGMTAKLLDLDEAMIGKNVNESQKDIFKLKLNEVINNIKLEIPEKLQSTNTNNVNNANIPELIVKSKSNASTTSSAPSEPESGTSGYESNNSNYNPDDITFLNPDLEVSGGSKKKTHSKKTRSKKSARKSSRKNKKHSRKH
jgi:hypothetical protein